jgi:hypothetical protein
MFNRKELREHKERILCTAIAQIDRRLRLNFSCGKTYEFISVGLAGGQERSENAAAKS